MVPGHSISSRESRILPWPVARFACPHCQTQKWGMGARPSPGVLSCVCLSAPFSCLPCDYPPCNSTALESSWYLASSTLLNELAVGMVCEVTALEALPRPQSKLAKATWRSWAPWAQSAWTCYPVVASAACGSSCGASACPSWMLMSHCLSSQCAVGHEYIADVGKHSSQTDASQGFGGKFGVQRDRADKVRRTEQLKTVPVARAAPRALLHARLWLFPKLRARRVCHGHTEAQHTLCRAVADGAVWDTCGGHCCGGPVPSRQNTVCPGAVVFAPACCSTGQGASNSLAPGERG